MNTPLVSVIMPVYNASAFLNDAIASILNQTFTDFELLIFDDGSTDQSLSIITSYVDHRIKLTRSKENKGYLHHLNEGIQLARGKYIARMDADDIALPQRLEKQVQFLEQHEDYAIVGGRVQILTPDGRIRKKAFNNFQASNILKLYALFQSPFIHPSVLMRRSVLQQLGGYDPDFYVAEDHHLWIRLLEQHKGTNLADTLLYYRAHPNNVTKKKKTRQRQSQRQLFRLKLELEGCTFSEKDLDTHFLLSSVNALPLRKQQVQAVGQWLNHLYHTSRHKNAYTQKELDTVFGYFMFQTCKLGWRHPIYTLGWYVGNSFTSTPKMLGNSAYLLLHWLVKRIGVR